MIETTGGDLVLLALYFAKLSLLAVGGGNSILPEMYRLTVDVQHWLTPEEFASLFAIAQATPGPNMLIVTLIGWHVAGIVGALTATLSLCAPACPLTYLTFRAWEIGSESCRERGCHHVTISGVAVYLKTT